MEIFRKDVLSYYNQGAKWEFNAPFFFSQAGYKLESLYSISLSPPPSRPPSVPSTSPLRLSLSTKPMVISSESLARKKDYWSQQLTDFSAISLHRYQLPNLHPSFFKVAFILPLYFQIAWFVVSVIKLFIYSFTFSK